MRVVAGCVAAISGATLATASWATVFSVTATGTLVTYKPPAPDLITQSATLQFVIDDAGAQIIRTVGPPPSYGDPAGFLASETITGATGTVFFNYDGYTSQYSGSVDSYFTNNHFLRDADTLYFDVTLTTASGFVKLAFNPTYDLSPTSTSLAANANLTVFPVTPGANVYNTIGPISSSLNYFTSISVVTALVPEPASWSLMLAGFGAIGMVMRRRKVVVSCAW